MRLALLPAARGTNAPLQKAITIPGANKLLARAAAAPVAPVANSGELHVAPVATAPVAAAAAVAAAPVALPATAAAILALPQLAAAPAAAKPANAKKWPKAGGKCWQVWQQCQQLADSGQHVNVAHLRAWAIANNANVSNATQEFYAWRKFVASNS